MRRLMPLALLTAICAGSPALAQEPTLDLGDPVPAIEIEHFFQGDVVESFSKEKTYVIEFWATW